MNICFSCGEKIEGKEPIHKNCLKILFGIEYLPEVDLSLSEVPLKAQESAGKLSISGVQPKLSMRLNREKIKLESVGQGGEYILKPPGGNFADMSQNENTCMIIASKVGITVPPHALIKLKDGSLSYIVKRFDRKNGEKVHQEDFFQILGKEDKYNSSFEQIGKRIKELSEIPGLDVQDFYTRVLFFFIIGNGDAHLKNFSILYDERGNIRLSPAYDIVSSKLVIPREDDTALTLNGKKNNIIARDFLSLLEYLQIKDRTINKRLLSKYDIIINTVKNSILEDNMRKNLLNIIQERYSRIKDLIDY